MPGQRIENTDTTRANPDNRSSRILFDRSPRSGAAGGSQCTSPWSAHFRGRAGIGSGSTSPPVSGRVAHTVRRRSWGATPVRSHSTGQITCGAEPARRDSPPLVECPQHPSSSHDRGRQPILNGGPCPVRQWNGSDVTTLANEISEDPVLFPALQILNPGDRPVNAADATAAFPKG